MPKKKYGQNMERLSEPIVLPKNKCARNKLFLSFHSIFSSFLSILKLEESLFCQFSQNLDTFKTAKSTKVYMLLRSITLSM